MDDITAQLAAYQDEIDRIKTQLANTTRGAHGAAQRAELFRAWVIARQEYGMLLRRARARRTRTVTIGES